ncbi:MAG: 4-hydroxythreonine-4-phosphate dehydrogenase PdxA [Syntrophothermus sp.]
MNKYIFTCGDVNGIGPEIVLKTLNEIISGANHQFIFYCPANIFEAYAKEINPSFNYSVVKSETEIKNEQVTIIDIGKTKFNLGKATSASGKSSFKAIQRSFNMLAFNQADAVITAPIAKIALSKTGIKFPGHTEMFAKWSNIKDYAMTFLSEDFNAALATIHIPIKDVPKAITEKRIRNLLRIIYNTCLFDLGIYNPKIAVLGLNPHAGEEGIIGKEEEKIIAPVLKEKEFRSFVEGCFSPDAFFANQLYRDYDFVIGMYHDQLLIPYKMLNFSNGVNYTAGLPIVRTSPDHGTAFDIAGQNIADHSSIKEAYNYAVKIVNNRKLNEEK